MEKTVLFAGVDIPPQLASVREEINPIAIFERDECLEILSSRGGIDVVVADVDFLDMFLNDFLESIRENHQRVRVILMGEGHIPGVPLDGGAFVYCVKPCDSEQLCFHLGKALIGIRTDDEIIYRTLVEKSEDGIVVVTDGKFKYANPRFLAQLGYGKDEFCGRDVTKFFHDRNLSNIKRNFKFDEPGRDEIILKKRDGSPLYMEYNLSYIRFMDRDSHLVMLRDITERKRLEEEITYISFHDKTTGLYNKAFFEQEIRRLDTHRQLPITIIIGDVDGLKLVNDAFGHIAGDELLKKAASIIKSCCRHEDIVARWGGDEFLILLPNSDKDVAEKIIARITGVLEKFNREGEQISISFGWETKYSEKEDIMEVFTRAENYMYRKKLIDSPAHRTSVIQGIIDTLFKRNKREALHAKRVSHISLMIGKKMGLKDEILEDIKIIGRIHDVGKIVLIDYILDKKEELTKEERKDIRRHPEVGYRILNSSTETSAYAPIVLAHHERHDGRGYPRGLKGEEIPLEARIVAVAEAFAAMTEEKPYGDALSLEQAKEEVKRCSGFQFHPEIARVMLEIIEGDPEHIMFHLKADGE